MTLAEINALDREAFTLRLGAIAEESPWVAYGAYDFRPFADALELVAAFRGAVARADDERQIALIGAHAALLPPDALLAGYERRLAHEPELGIAIALDEVVKIIRLRIADLLAV